ncbi:MAG: hypothetical protein WKH64_11950 [Chloroflexia bacterium]
MIETTEYKQGGRKLLSGPDLDALDFPLPADLEAGEPPEARGSHATRCA